MVLKLCGFGVRDLIFAGALFVVSAVEHVAFFPCSLLLSCMVIAF